MTLLIPRIINNVYAICKNSSVRNMRQINFVNRNEPLWESGKFALVENPNQKVLKVAIIGMPNAGKSSIINNIMDRKVCAASSKVHTTRIKSKAIFTHDDSQIVFLDTPGLINDREKKKHKLENSFVNDIQKCLNLADTIAVIHDVSNGFFREKLDIKIINFLEQYKNTNSILIINKVDTLKSKRKLLEITRLLTENSIDGKTKSAANATQEEIDFKGWPFFKEVFMVSALTGDGLQDLKQYFISQAKPGTWLFPQETWTDQSPEQIIVNTVKATFLDFLPQEIPYKLKPQLEMLDVDKKGVLTTVIIVQCPTKRIANLIAGASDGRLRQITQAVQKDLQDCFQNFVRLKIILEPKNLDE